jgi:hypothetical protein
MLLLVSPCPGAFAFIKMPQFKVNAKFIDLCTKVRASAELGKRLAGSGYR